MKNSKFLNLFFITLLLFCLSGFSFAQEINVVTNSNDEVQTWANSDATPSIDIYKTFETGTVAVTITQFDDAPADEVKEFKIIVKADGVVLDSETDFDSSTKIYCPGGIDLYLISGDIVYVVWDKTRAVVTKIQLR